MRNFLKKKFFYEKGFFYEKRFFYEKKFFYVKTKNLIYVNAKNMY